MEYTPDFYKKIGSNIMDFSPFTNAIPVSIHLNFIPLSNIL